MKRTRNSKTIDSLSNVDSTEENDPKKMRLNKQKKKIQAENFTPDVENDESRVNSRALDQDSNIPVEMKLNFKNLREELIAANSSQKKRKGEPKRETNLEIMRRELKQLEDPPVSKEKKEIMSARLTYSFFNKPCEELAQNILGKILVRQLENGTILKARIVETECYIGAVDKASATYDYRISASTLPLYMPPGTIYVYSTYGMYHCMNISSQGDGCAVLIRALSPMEGAQRMSENRNSGTKSSLKKPKKEFKPQDMCNGPAKLCMAFELTRQHNKYSLCSWRGLWIEDDNSDEKIEIIHCKRIGIDKCEPTWREKPLRFYIYGNTSVSKQDKKAEERFLKKQ